jgi:hypothetical protein
MGVMMLLLFRRVGTWASRVRKYIDAVASEWASQELAACMYPSPNQELTDKSLFKVSFLHEP